MDDNLEATSLDPALCLLVHCPLERKVAGHKAPRRAGTGELFLPRGTFAKIQTFLFL
jgi:hypothetical protein